jgi:glycerol transport system ATP-binding protein
MGIRVEGLSKEYQGKFWIKDLSWDIPSGSFTTVLAPTGTGKTTLLRLLAGIDKPTRGKIFYDDVDVTHLAVQARNIAMVYQEFINYPSLTVYENIASPLRVSRTKYSKKDIDEKVQRLAKLLRIGHVLDHIPEQLSGGEKQRTAIARALVKGARFIFLDEPLGNLDYKLREELRGELKTVFKGCTIVYATPEPIDALVMSSHVGFLHDGKIIQFGLVNDVYTKPAFAEVGYYFNDPPMNLLDCRPVSEDGKLYLKASECLKFEVERFKDFLKDPEYILGLRPQHVCVSEAPVPGSLALKATIDFTEIVGSATTLHLLHESLRMGCVVNKPEKRHKAGQEITVYIDPCCLFVFEKKSRSLVIADSKAVCRE